MEVGAERRVLVVVGQRDHRHAGAKGSADGIDALRRAQAVRRVVNGQERHRGRASLAHVVLPQAEIRALAAGGTRRDQAERHGRLADDRSIHLVRQQRQRKDAGQAHADGADRAAGA
jgi:hypothetical protein